MGYGDDFEQFHGFGQNQVAALPVPLVPSTPVVYAKHILVSINQFMHQIIGTDCGLPFENYLRLHIILQGDSYSKRF